MKKAQVGTSFNWLFVVIAGAVILVFFIFVLTQLQQASELKLAAKVLANFDTILNGAKVSPNTVNVIESSDALKFELTCFSEGASQLIIPETTVSKDVSQKIFLAADTVEGNQIIVNILPIYKPIQVDNAVLVTDDLTYFAVWNVDNRSVLDDVYAALPKNISKGNIKLFESYLKSYKKVIIVSNRAPLSLTTPYIQYGQQNLKNVAVNWLVLSGSTITFYEKPKNSATFSAPRNISVPTTNDVLFAMFSKDAEYYQCTQKKIGTRTKAVATIYQYRTAEMKDNIGLADDAPCSIMYDEASSIFAQMSANANYDGSGLEEINLRLIQASCPAVY